MDDDDLLRYYDLAGIGAGEGSARSAGVKPPKKVQVRNGGYTMCGEACPPITAVPRPDGIRFDCANHGTVHAHGPEGQCSEIVHDTLTGSSVCLVTGAVVLDSSLYDGGEYVSDYNKHVPHISCTIVDHFGNDVDAADIEAVQPADAQPPLGVPSRCVAWVAPRSLLRVSEVAEKLVDALLFSSVACAVAEKRAIRVASSAMRETVIHLNAMYETAKDGGCFDMMSAIAKLAYASREYGSRNRHRSVRRIEYYATIIRTAWSVFPPGPATRLSIVPFAIGVLYCMRRPDGLVVPSVVPGDGGRVIRVLPYDPYLKGLPAPSDLDGMPIHGLASGKSELVLSAHSVQSGCRLVRKSVQDNDMAAVSVKRGAETVLKSAQWASHEAGIAAYFSSME